MLFVFRDALATAIINCFTSILAGFVVFSVLGYMAHITQKDIDKVAMEGSLYCVIYRNQTLHAHDKRIT